MNIRHAIPEDAPAIAHVHVATWQSTYAGIVPQTFLDALNVPDSASMWTSWLALPEIYICVAETPDAVVGFAAGGPIRKPILHIDGELYAIYLLPEMHGRGIGRQLVTHVETELKRQGRQQILAWVLRDNPATSFYARLGGNVVAEDTIKIGGIPLQEFAYAWPLQPSHASGGAA